VVLADIDEVFVVDGKKVPGHIGYAEREVSLLVAGTTMGSSIVCRLHCDVVRLYGLTWLQY
jgi:hypothetical protein